MCVTLARPEKKNALTGAMYEALIAAFAQASGDDDDRRAAARGQGRRLHRRQRHRRFPRLCARPGAEALRRRPRVSSRRWRASRSRWSRRSRGRRSASARRCASIATSSTPRRARGSRCRSSISAWCRRRASSLLAPQRFGHARAAEFLLLAEPFDAEAARELGLVNADRRADELHAHALAKAKALAAKPRAALLATRRLMRGDPAILVARMDEEMRLFGEAVRSPEARAAFFAFLQKAKA